MYLKYVVQKEDPKSTDFLLCLILPSRIGVALQRPIKKPGHSLVSYTVGSLHSFHTSFPHWNILTSWHNFFSIDTIPFFQRFLTSPCRLDQSSRYNPEKLGRAYRPSLVHSSTMAPQLTVAVRRSEPNKSWAPHSPFLRLPLCCFSCEFSLETAQNFWDPGTKTHPFHSSLHHRQNPWLLTVLEIDSTITWFLGRDQEKDWVFFTCREYETLASGPTIPHGSQPESCELGVDLCGIWRKLYSCSSSATTLTVGRSRGKLSFS